MLSDCDPKATVIGRKSCVSAIVNTAIATTGLLRGTAGQVIVPTES